MSIPVTIGLLEAYRTHQSIFIT